MTLTPFLPPFPLPLKQNEVAPQERERLVKISNDPLPLRFGETPLGGAIIPTLYRIRVYYLVRSSIDDSS